MISRRQRDACVNLTGERGERLQFYLLACMHDRAEPCGLIFHRPLDAGAGQDVVEGVEQNSLPGFLQVAGGFRGEGTDDRIGFFGAEQKMLGLAVEEFQFCHGGIATSQAKV